MGAVHACEAWQMLDGADGRYCGACGEPERAKGSLSVVDNSGMTDEPTTTIDYRDLRPKGRGPDRRHEHRRQEDRNLHYAREILCVTAGICVDRMLAPETTDDESFEALLSLARAVQTYRECADAAAPSLSVTVPRETDGG